MKNKAGPEGHTLLWTVAVEALVDSRLRSHGVAVVQITEDLDFSL